MSAVSSVFSAADPYQSTNQNAFVQFVNDFNAIGNALNSGDLSTAQSALAAFQQDLPANSQTSGTQPFGNNSQANADYTSLATALQSGDLSGAQNAFASLQNDLEGGGKAHRRHHRGSGDSGSADPAASTSTTSAPSDAADSLLDALA